MSTVWENTFHNGSRDWPLSSLSCIYPGPVVTFPMAFSTLVLKPCISQSLSFCSHLEYPLLRLICNLTTRYLAVTGGGIVGQCPRLRLSDPNWLLGALPFLPERDYVTFGSLLSQFRLSVCRLSVVCMSVTLVHPTQGVEAFGKISSPLCTLAILWPPCKILRPTETPPSGALNARGVSK